MSRAAFIPKPNEALQGLGRVNRDLIAQLQRRRPQSTATLDMDATLVETCKEEAFYCYKKFKAYQPLNTYWAEQAVVLHTRVSRRECGRRTGPVAGLAGGAGSTAEGGGKVRMRSDTAGYQHELLACCEDGKGRFGRIEFAVGCDVSPEFKKSVAEVLRKDWQDENREVDGGEKKGRQWAEVCFVPNAIRRSKKGREYRYLAIREVIRQPILPGMEEQRDCPFKP